eukprot:TRINITY_DN9329_c0_g1_i1.p1 TRINITY_DN9329_c0_g1~~TRINITY_DN9329_c0_g1_i1.p1  ORF type:complete len:287 (-),score=84.61 TRINITY_DN9329_c0_g1_i1:8-742(-)
MKTFLTKGAYKEAQKILDSGDFRTSMDSVKIKAPIYDPEKILCVGLNYRDHAIESKMAIPTEPVIFSKFNNTIVGPGDNIIKPEETNELDFEAELVVVIGKEGSKIKKEKAFDFIAGYTVGHDVSARDWQLKKSSQWLLGKTFDTFAPIGPAIVTSVPNPQKLDISCSLNGKTVQHSNTDQMIFPIDELIAYISRVVTLKPGDLIFTGTPPGVGFGRNPPIFMKPGDNVVVSIENLGSLENTVV